MHFLLASMAADICKAASIEQHHLYGTINTGGCMTHRVIAADFDALAGLHQQVRLRRSE